MSALLTTLDAVKQFIGNTLTSNADPLINNLIARESRAIERWTGRTFSKVVRTNHRLNGSGTQSIILPDGPIVSVEFLSIYEVEVPAAASSLVNGYLVVPSMDQLVLTVGRFPSGLQSVVCSWTAGFVSAESDVIPTGNTPTLTPAYGGRAIENISVLNTTTNELMAEVASSPASGQYVFDEGEYEFASADANVPVTMNYYCIPGPVEQACIEMVALDLKQRTNVGITSQSIDGQSVSYDMKSMTAGTKDQLFEYKKRVPL
jgi:hypothetical protein